MIVNIPIEPLEWRYSAQWRKWFDDQLTAADVSWITIDGEATSGHIHNGSFLDVMETNQYKTSQLANILQCIKLTNTKGCKDQQDYPKSLTLLFHDIWFPGLANIAYVRDGLGLKNLKICGCLHAGSYDDNDFLNKVNMTPWARHLEKGWFQHIVDAIFVATNYHKDLLVRTRQVPEDKVFVTGFPLYDEGMRDNDIEKDNIIVFPHRLDAEKQPELFARLKDRLSTALPDWKFVYTAKEATNKAQYYELLSAAKFAISFALQETWGIAMQEAAICGAIPLCPDRLSYPELYPTICLYEEDEHDLTRRLLVLIKKLEDLHITEILTNSIRKSILDKGVAAIPNMLAVMREL